MANHGVRRRRAVGRLALLALVATVLSAASLLRAQETASEQLEAELITVPVELDGVELFRVRGVSSLPAHERARLIHDRIVAAARNRAISPDSLAVVDGEFATRVQAGDRMILSITDADAKLEQVDRHALAVAHLHRVQEAIVNYRAERAPPAVRGEIGRSLVATVMLLAALLVLHFLWTWIDRMLSARLRTRISGIGIQSFEVIRAERIWGAVHNTAVTLWVVAIGLLVIIYIGYVLAQFPASRHLSRDMATFALDPVRQLGMGFVHSIPKLVFLAVLFVVLRLMLRMIRLFFGAVERGAVKLPRFEAIWAQPTYKMVRVAVIAFGLIIAYPYIPGSNSAAFQGVSLFVGIMFSLGSSSVISNIIAGYAMIYRRAFKIGDRIKVGNSLGDVVETRLQVTHLRSVKNEELIIPNSHILASDVINYSSLANERGLILHTEVGIGYETAWRHVEAMLIEAAGRTEGLGTEPRPYVLINKLGEFAVTYELNVFCTNVHVMGKLYSALHRNVLDVFNEQGVQIMTPAYEGDPRAPKVPPHDDWSAPDALSKPH